MHQSFVPPRVGRWPAFGDPAEGLQGALPRGRPLNRRGPVPSPQRKIKAYASLRKAHGTMAGARLARAYPPGLPFPQARK
jgi:hypothetical protein